MGSNTFKLLKSINSVCTLKLVSNKISYWGDNDNWEWPQIAINRQIGFELYSGDWAIHFDSDYLLPEFEYSNNSIRRHQTRN